MFLAKRSAVSARNLLRNRQPRRFDSHASGHAQPVNEGFGRGFYVAVGTIAISFALYRYHKSTKDSGSESWISQLITKYTPSKIALEQRGIVHTAAMEKAAHDRHLFHSQRRRDYIELTNPEILNAGGPYNVTMGSLVDLSDVAAHYDRENRRAEEARIARMKDGRVTSIYD